MPVRLHKDSIGPYYQWGNQAIYRYKPGNAKSREMAKAKAAKQGLAIKVSQLKVKECKCKH